LAPVSRRKRGADGGSGNASTSNADTGGNMDGDSNAGDSNADDNNTDGDNSDNDANGDGGGNADYGNAPSLQSCFLRHRQTKMVTQSLLVRNSPPQTPAHLRKRGPVQPVLSALVGSPYYYLGICDFLYIFGYLYRIIIL
jgi:hypothetical protein